MPLEKAKRREPEKASIREALGIAYFRIHRYAEAETEFRKMLELAPVDDYAHYALGRALEAWARGLAEGGRFDPEVERAVDVARVVDRMGGRPCAS